MANLSVSADASAAQQSFVARGGLSAASIREDLAQNPENGWSLFGLAQCLRARRAGAEAEAVEERFRRAWACADVTLSASRF